MPYALRSMRFASLRILAFLISSSGRSKTWRNTSPGLIVLPGSDFSVSCKCIESGNSIFTTISFKSIFFNFPFRFLRVRGASDRLINDANLSLSKSCPTSETWYVLALALLALDLSGARRQSWIKRPSGRWAFKPPRTVSGLTKSATARVNCSWRLSMPTGNGSSKEILGLGWNPWEYLTGISARLSARKKILTSSRWPKYFAWSSLD